MASGESQMGLNASQVAVARAAGVSQKTVSRVVNGSPGVSDETRRAVVEAIDHLNYRPNSAARALASRRSSMIGIATFGETAYSTYANIIGIERAAKAAGYSTMIASSGDLKEGSEQAIRELIDRGVDGIIVSEPIDETLWDVTSVGNTPFVTIGSERGRNDRVMVGYDQARAAGVATEHLLSLGHETVWHIAGPADSSIARDRRHGWQCALDRADRPVPDVLQADDWTSRAGYEAGRLLMRTQSVTAVFAANDKLAIGLMRAAAEYGRRIPDDLAIVGFDDTPDSEYQMVPLTTIHEDPLELSRRAVSELVALMSGTPAQSHKVELPLELVVRRSSIPDQ